MRELDNRDEVETLTYYLILCMNVLVLSFICLLSYFLYYLSSDNFLLSSSLSMTVALKFEMKLS